MTAVASDFGASTASVDGGIEIAYEEFGSGDDPTLLLIMGLGVQMLGWDDQFCRLLAEQGFHVVRFDNRDIGLSTKTPGRAPDVRRGMLGFTGGATYRLENMAADTVGLLDHLGVSAAHLVGASMGGMIAQTVAALHPERSLSLTSIMSGPGGRDPRFLPRLAVLGVLLARPPTDPDAYAEHSVSVFEKIGSPGYRFDADRIRERARESLERSYHPAGVAKQMMAIMASGDRREQISKIDCPTLVVHGKRDKLVPAAAGRATAKAIPGARLELIEGMGHDLPAELWPRLVELVTANAAAASAV